LSIDPVTTDANTGSSFNRYAYAANNPFKYIDPDGRDPAFTCFVRQEKSDAWNATIGQQPRSEGWHGAQAKSLNEALQMGVGAGTGGILKGAAAIFGSSAKVEIGGAKLFHYTDAAGAKAIEESGKIISNAKGQVFLTAESMSAKEVTNALFIGNSGTKGTHVVELSMKEGAVVTAGKNPKELVHAGTIRNGRQADLKVKLNDN
jgi:hypothetical protein